MRGSERMTVIKTGGDWTEHIGEMSDRFELDIQKLGTLELYALRHIIELYICEDEEVIE